MQPDRLAACKIVAILLLFYAARLGEADAQAVGPRQCRVTFNGTHIDSTLYQSLPQVSAFPLAEEVSYHHD